MQPDNCQKRQSKGQAFRGELHQADKSCRDGLTACHLQLNPEFVLRLRYSQPEASQKVCA